MERTRPAPLTAEETQQVLERASELQRSKVSAQPLIDAAEPSLDFAELEKIGLESGMTREAIQRAYLELRTGKLAPKPEATFAEKWLGPELLTAERPLAMLPEQAERALEAALKTELLHPAEQDGDRIIWAQAPGVWAALQRGFKGHQTWKHSTLTSEVKLAPPGLDAQSLLKLEAELQGRYTPLLAAFGASVVPAFITIACAVDPSGPGLAISAFFGAITAGATAFAFTVRRNVQFRRMRALRLGITRVLDRVAGKL